MTYKLKGGEEVRDGKLYGWTGARCPHCGGHGEDDAARPCTGCGGTGEEWGLMPEQPTDLPLFNLGDAIYAWKYWYGVDFAFLAAVCVHDARGTGGDYPSCFRSLLPQ